MTHMQIVVVIYVYSGFDELRFVREFTTC